MVSMPDRSRVMTQMKRYPGPPDWGLGMRLTPHHKKILLQNLKEMNLD
jgi:hypothetical protein